HEESMLAVSYWSFFDDIQNIQQKEIKLINFKELNWPKGTYFVYTPFLVLAKHGGEIIARIQFAENGNLLLIELLIDGVLDKIMIFDDRG
ncbi:accessory Sec system glycosyltransferase Asp1, partial [Streptococcus suis]